MINVDRKIDSWKNQLLDLGKRNRLLNYRDTKRSNLRIKQPDLPTLWNSFVVKEAPLEFPYIEETSNTKDVQLSLDPSADQQKIINLVEDSSGIVTNQSPKEQQKTLRSIRDKTRTVLEEQGVNVLYLSFGFLKWYESEHSEQVLYSPLILVPVSITWESITSPFILKLYEDDIVLNPTLAYKLENDFGIKFPDFDEDGDIIYHLAEIESIVSRNNWYVEKEIGLSLFSFLKINMYKDLEMNRDKIKANQVVRALCGDLETIDKKLIEEINDFDHDSNVPTDIFQVVDADASQQDAILCAKRGASFVLQGPPGTGKSQTITNIIAECLADGKKVLFVSEKMAALEVVYKRLSSVGLNDFCLTLHSHKANKKETLEQLRTALNLSRKKAELSDEAFLKLERLKAERDELNAYADAIHIRIEPLSKSIYEVNGQLANLQGYDDVIFSLCDIDKISAQTFNEYISLLTKFADTIGKMTGDYRHNPWYGANVPFVSHELRHDIQAKLSILIPQCLELSLLFDDIVNELDAKFVPTYENIEKTISILGYASTSPIIPNSWVAGSDIEPLYQEITHTQEMIGQLHELLAQYSAIVDDLSLHDVKADFDSMPPQNTKEAEEQIAYFNNTISAHSCFARWSAIDSITPVEKLLEEVIVQVSHYDAIRDDILAEYEADIFKIDYKGILIRFRTEYTSFFKIFKRQYKQDRKNVQAHMKQMVKKIDDILIIAVANKLNDLSVIEGWFDENGSLLNEYFLDYSNGVKTDLETIRKNIEQYTAMEEAIKVLENAKKLFVGIDENENALRHHYEFLYKGLSTNWTDVRTRLDWAHGFREIITKHELNHQFAQYICSNKNKINRCAYYHTVLSEKYSQLTPNYQWFSALFDTETAAILSKSTLLQLADRCELCAKGQSLLEEWIDFRIVSEKCTQTVLKEYVECIAQMNINKVNIVPIFKKRFYRLWLDDVLPQYPAVMNFRRRVYENTAKEFSKLDVSQFDIAKARIQQRLISALPSLDRFSSGGDELSILRRELGKQRKIMPIRKLFKAIPNLLMALKPCLMMSPLSVSLFLESENYTFDTIIFDEASQVRTENAIGAILRGKQVIIAGDSKQLPPTNFFAVTTSDTDFDIEDDDSDDSGAYESILEEAALLPERTLLWHYRSRHEHLIAFSNAKIYYNSLITFPSNEEKIVDSGVEYLYVKDGTYDRGGKKGNAAEAKRVAELVFEHFDKFPHRSLGVIAFGEVQQQAIDIVLRQMRMTQQQYEPFFNEDREEAFFIKNLENVQGDERDTIIFSIGYAKPPVGEMHMNFGPLSRVGGERRLNVAITRAKHNVKLVGSIMPTDIVTERISADGPKLLRSYIDFANNGPSVILGETTESDIVEHDSPFEKAVYDFLDRKGYSLRTQVGCTGYRIDMAVKHPTISDKYVLGIECDGASYHSARTARERDRLRQSVLESMGWTIYRIWSTDWIKDPITEGEKLLEAVNAAISGFPKDLACKKALASNSTEDVFIQKTKDDTRYLIVENKEESDNPYGLIPYAPASFDDLPRHNGDLDIKDCIRVTVANEFPIHYELLCQKLAPLYGRQKVTSVVRRGVDAALSRMKSEVELRNNFIFPIPMKNIVIKTPNDRKIDYVSTEELAEAMYIIAGKCVGSTKISLIQEVSRTYGYNRIGEKINLAMQKAFDSLLHSRRIDEIEGKIVTK